MTTIAWDGVTLAADSQITDVATVFSSCHRKITLYKRLGILIAFCGNTPSEAILREFLIDSYECDVPLTNFPGGSWDAVLIRFGDGMLPELYTASSGPEQQQCLELEFKNETTTGSGGSFAQGALCCGVGAIHAVKVAILNDVYSSGAVTFYNTSTDEFSNINIIE